MGSIVIHLALWPALLENYCAWSDVHTDNWIYHIKAAGSERWHIKKFVDAAALREASGNSIFVRARWIPEKISRGWKWQSQGLIGMQQGIHGCEIKAYVCPAINHSIQQRRICKISDLICRCNFLQWSLGLSLRMDPMQSCTLFWFSHWKWRLCSGCWLSPVLGNKECTTQDYNLLCHKPK